MNDTERELDVDVAVTGSGSDGLEAYRQTNRRIDGKEVMERIRWEHNLHDKGQSSLYGKPRSCGCCPALADLFVVVRTAVIPSREAQRMTMPSQATGIFEDHHRFTREYSQP